MSGWRVRPKASPEDSIAMRVVVAMAVEVGLVAVISQGVVDDRTALLALVLAPLGYWVSYRRRRGSNVAIKALLAVGLLVATARFLSQMGSVLTPDAARAPLAMLFIWVQVLHAFDVPRRRDLAFSMVSSTTLIAVGGALALTTAYVGFLFTWAALAGVWLWVSARPLVGDVTPSTITRSREGRRARAAPVRAVGTVVVSALIFAALVFASMPRLPGTLVRAMPFRMPGTQSAAPAGDHVENPALPTPTDGAVVDFSAAGYPGFSDAMDLRSRGALSNDVVFRVRAPFGSLWRAEVFDTFDGTVWTRSGSPLHDLQTTDDGGYQMPQELDPGWGGRTLVQTFFIDQPQPNVLFAAGAPHIVYFPAGGLRADRDLSIRSPIFLDAGLVYSVESRVPDVTPQQLERVRMSAHLEQDRYLQRYLQLPAELPQRVRDLAAQITAGSATEYDAVMAVQTWLQTNTRYDLTVPREPDGVDAVDRFLFVTRRGFCEHIASAMAVLLRAEGIPSRIVTGYGPGERNPFTGYYEVRGSDAHAWLEVYYPGVGWIPYDPTFGVPPVPDAWSSPIGADLVAWAGQHLAAAMPSWARTGIANAAHRAVAAARSGARAWPALAFLMLAGVAVALVRRRRGARPAPPDDIGAAFQDLVAALEAAGVEPDPARTPSELRDAVAREPALAGEAARQVTFVVETFEHARFGRPGSRPGPDEVLRARAAAARVRALTGHR